MTELAPITLADRIPTITEVIADRIKGVDKLGYEFYHFTTTVKEGAEGLYIELEVSEYGTHPHAVTVYVHVSTPISRRGPVPGTNGGDHA
jgi:hypothetical protein